MKAAYSRLNLEEKYGNFKFPAFAYSFVDAYKEPNCRNFYKAEIAKEIVFYSQVSKCLRNVVRKPTAAAVEFRKNFCRFGRELKGLAQQILSCKNSTEILVCARDFVKVIKRLVSYS